MIFANSLFFLIKKSDEIEIFHIILWKNAISAFLFVFLWRKMPKRRFFHIILWKCRFGIFFHFSYEEKRRNGDFHIILWKKCHFGIFFVKKNAETLYYIMKNAVSAYLCFFILVFYITFLFLDKNIFSIHLNNFFLICNCFINKIICK